MTHGLQPARGSSGRGHENLFRGAIVVVHVLACVCAPPPEMRRNYTEPCFYNIWPSNPFLMDFPILEISRATYYSIRGVQYHDLGYDLAEIRL